MRDPAGAERRRQLLETADQGDLKVICPRAGGKFSREGRQYGDLMRDGLLTPEEFETRKAQLLAGAHREEERTS